MKLLHINFKFHFQRYSVYASLLLPIEIAIIFSFVHSVSVAKILRILKRSVLYQDKLN